MESTKKYCADVVLGVETTTDDAEGEIVSHAEPSGVTQEQVGACLRRLTGEIEQVPPMYAAVKRDGKKLYELARADGAWRSHRAACASTASRSKRRRPPLVRLTVQCGPGTYIRALARDLGRAIGVGGYLHALRRQSSGSFAVERACTLEVLETTAISEMVEPVDHAVVDWPAAIVAADEEARVRNGIGFGAPDCERLRVYGQDGTLIALARAEGGVATALSGVLAGGGMNAGR